MDEQKPIVAMVTERQLKEAAGKDEEPKCPHCGMDPLRLHVLDQRSPVGNVVIVTRTIICKNCRAPLPIYFMGIEGEQSLITTATQLPKLTLPV